MKEKILIPIIGIIVIGIILFNINKGGIDMETQQSMGKLLGVNTTDIKGQEYLGEMFKENELTLVNVWATWCPPCVAEIPELEEVYIEMQDKNIGVIGIVSDVVQNGEVDESILNTAKGIVEAAEVTFPMIYPDAVIEENMLKDLLAYPTTYFVDKNGDIVSEAYTGARDKEQWITIIENELEKLK